MHRPQFAYPLPPAPCIDQTCQFGYDSSNLPSLVGNLAAGSQTGRIPLKGDKDAPFFIRAIKTQGAISVRFEDPNGNPLSDLDNVNQTANPNSTNFEIPSEYSNPAGAGVVTLESGAGGIFIPQSGTLLAYLYNGTASSVALSTVAFNLIGVKRYTGELCQ